MIKRPSRGLLGICTVGLCAPFQQSALAAVTINVTTTANNTTDDGVCSLREAIHSANYLTSLNGDCPAGQADGTTIQLGTGTYSVNVQLPIYRGGVTIRGAGPTSTVVRGNLSSAELTLFNVAGVDGLVKFEGLRVEGGTLSGQVTGITVLDDDGATELILEDAAISDFTHSGLRLNGGYASLVRTSVYGNSSAGHGGGIYVVTYNGVRGILALSQSSIHDNHSGANGGGIYYNSFGNNQWSDSTISSNTAHTYGGGVYVRGTSDYVQFNRVTVARNDAYKGGGFNLSSINSANVYIFDSIFADNTADVAGSLDGSGLVSNAEYSLFETSGSISFAVSAGLIFGVDAQLGALQSVAGKPPTPVHPLGSSSPARNVKSWSNATSDQLGNARCLGGGSTPCDIGAVERQ